MLTVACKRGFTVRLIRSFCVGIAIFIVAGGCTSLPRHTPEDLWRMLPGGRSMYLSARIPANRALIKSILGNVMDAGSAISLTVDRTETVVISIRPRQNAGPLMDIVASGNFPEALIGWQMFWDRDWTQQKVTVDGRKLSWWESGRDGLQITAAGNSLLRVSNGKILDLITVPGSGRESMIPEEAREMGNGTDFFVYFPNPAEIFSESESGAGVFFGLTSFWMGLVKIPARSGPSEYSVRGTFVVKDERSARVYGALIKVAFAAWINRMGIGNLKTVQEQLILSTDGNKIRFEGLRIPEASLSKVVTDFLVENLRKNEQKPREG